VPYGVKVPVPVAVPYYNGTINSGGSKSSANNGNSKVESLENEFDDIMNGRKRDIKRITYED